MSNPTELVQIGGVSRRDLLRRIALGLTAAGGGLLEADAAQHVHAAAGAEKKQSGAYKVKAFAPHEYQTLRRLAEMIVPADEVSGSALEAGAPEFIDLLCSQNEELRRIFTGGLGWLDGEMQRRYEAKFTAATAAQQTAMFDLLVEAEKQERARRAEQLVYRKSEHYKDFSGYATQRRSELGPGIVFFDWVRKMTVDAFYTSPIGIKDLGYKGNGAMSRYEVPREAMEYALKRSPFGSA